MTFLSPLGLLVGLAAVFPVTAWFVARRRVKRVREALGLSPPPGHELRRPAAAAAAVLLLALACAQPAVTRDEERRMRQDAAVMVLVDVSRSMQAAPSDGATTRLERARDLAVRLRDGLADIPVGVASVTDRAVPLLFPSADPAAFEQTVRRALAPEAPPPREVNAVATTLAAVGEAASANLFLPSDQRRAFVLLTDGESRPYAEGDVARALGAARTELVAVHVGAPTERVFRRDGTPERLYRPDPRARATVEALAAAAEGTAVGEEDVGAAVRATERALGSGPTRAVAGARRLVLLAPWLALLALLPLTVALEPRLRLRAKGLRHLPARVTIVRR